MTEEEKVVGNVINVGTEDEYCESPSEEFKGVCISDTNCGAVCRTEGFESGRCRGLLLNRRCICIKHCDMDSNI